MVLYYGWISISFSCNILLIIIVLIRMEHNGYAFMFNCGVLHG
jgi:hypothetical protein